jgi:hypothetical protein
MQRTLLQTAPLLVGLIAGGSLEVHDESSWVGVERVKVRWDAGDIQVRAHDTTAVHVQKLGWGPEAPLAYTARQDAEILVLELQCRTPAPCGGDLEISLPPGVTLELDLGEGHASLQGPMGDSSVIVGNGSIAATGLTASEAVLQVVNGGIDADWATVPTRVVVATVTGDVELRLPLADYSLEDQLGHSTMVGLRDVQGASSRVQVTTIEGSAHIYGVRSIAAL